VAWCARQPGATPAVCASVGAEVNATLNVGKRAGLLCARLGPCDTSLGPLAPNAALTVRRGTASRAGQLVRGAHAAQRVCAVARLRLPGGAVAWPPTTRAGCACAGNPAGPVHRRWHC
jgi:hypothetical protein